MAGTELWWQHSLGLGSWHFLLNSTRQGEAKSPQWLIRIYGALTKDCNKIIIYLYEEYIFHEILLSKGIGKCIGYNQSSYGKTKTKTLSLHKPTVFVVFNPVTIDIKNNHVTAHNNDSVQSSEFKCQSLSHASPTSSSVNEIEELSSHVGSSIKYSGRFFVSCWLARASLYSRVGVSQAVSGCRWHVWKCTVVWASRYCCRTRTKNRCGHSFP